MSVYRIPEFKIADTGQVAHFRDTPVEDDTAAGAKSIDVVSVDNGKDNLAAKCATQALLEAATDINKKALGKLIVAGLVNAGSIGGRSGEVVFSC